MLSTPCKTTERVAAPEACAPRFFLLAAAGQQQPELVITANVSGLELIDIAGEDLQCAPRSVLEPCFKFALSSEDRPYTTTRIRQTSHRWVLH